MCFYLYVSGAYQDKWEVTAFYLCDQEHKLDMMYNMDMKQDDGSETAKQPKCQPPDMRSPHCFKYGQNVTMLNLFGAETHNDAREMTYVYIGTQRLESRCHQHVEEFACRSMYPECEESDVLYPCRSMCYEVLSACGGIFEGFPVLDCKAYPVKGNGTLCFSRPVECPPPKPPKHGKVHYNSIFLRGKATYTCGEGYRLLGDEIRACMANGTWSGATPQCEPIIRPLPSATTISMIILMSILFVTVITLVIVVCEQRLQLFKFSALRNSLFFTKDRDSQKEKDIMILHHDFDYPWVQDELAPKLNKCFEIMVQGEGQLPGKPHFDFTQDAINKCRNCIVVITEDYISCNLEIHRLRLVQLEHVQKGNFKVIVVLLKISRQSMPDHITALLQFIECVEFDSSPRFWEDLFGKIPEQSRPERQSHVRSILRRLGLWTIATTTTTITKARIV